MRSDKKLKKDYTNSELWAQDSISGKSGDEVDRYKLPDNRKARLSLSGSESNSFFMRNEAGEFRDISGITGLDLGSDSRCIATLDFDRDGYQDFVVTNTNKSTLNIFHNRGFNNERTKTNFVAVRVVGGNSTNQSNSKHSNRDAIGTRVFVHYGESKSLTEIRCGHGLATQASQTKIIGIGDSNTIDKIEVVFPSGVRRNIANAKPGSLNTFFENAAEANAENGVNVSTYQSSKLVRYPALRGLEKGKKVDLKLEPSNAPLRLVLSMRTSCEKCRSKIDEVATLQDQFGDRLEIIAVPIDLQDSQDELDSYVAQYKPAYRLLKNDMMRSLNVIELVKKVLGDGALPHSFILSDDDRVLRVMRGLPTVSEIRILARDQGIELTK